MGRLGALAVALVVAIAFPIPCARAASRDIPVWLEGQKQGGWGGNHNSAVTQDPEGLILTAGRESYYGSAFRDIGEVDLAKTPYFAVTVDRATGGFGCKLIHGQKRDKQVIFRPALRDGCFLTHLPSQTGWSGKARFHMGIYCHGQGRSLRVTRIQFVAAPTQEILVGFEQTLNQLFDSSFELDARDKPPLQTWHRLGSYLPEPTPWRIAAGDALHGKQCAATTKPGKLTIQREVHARGAGTFTFSVHLKAGRAGHRARLSVTTYRQGRPFRTRTESKEVAVGAEWGRHHITVDVPRIRNRGVLGPVDLTVESLDEGELCADAVQLEQGERPTLYGPHESLLSARRVPDLRASLYPPVVEPPAPAEAPAGRPAAIPLAPVDGTAPPARGWPMVGCITLPQGASWDPARWSVKGAGGAPLPVQTRVLARWKGDGSLKALQLTALADGSKRWVAEHDAAAVRPRVEAPAPPQSDAPELVVEALDGRAFAATPAPGGVRMEESGPLRRVARVEGSHVAGDDHLLSYVLRTHTYAGCRLWRLEYTWVNTSHSPTMVVRSMACRIPLGGKRAQGAVFTGAKGQAHAVPAAGGSLLQCDERKRYFYEVWSGGKSERFDGKAAGRVRVDLGDEVLEVQVEDWWQNHPLELAVEPGAVVVYFWSPRVKPVELTRGMAKTHILHLWRGPKEEAPRQMAGPTLLVPPPRVHCGSGVFGGRILPSQESPFPLFEQAVNSRRCRARMDPEVMLATDCYGQLNYGDCMGDGGWANLETQRGHAAWLHTLRTGDPRMFAVAQAAARHYRDVDIDQLSGATITHNPSHTLGGKSTSHAWIQGLLDHYLVTGERRSMEVALLHADYLKGMALDRLVRGGRTVTRILDNLADLYTVTGDDALVAKYHAVVAAQRENLRKGTTQFPGLFQSERYGQWTYPGNFVPWYGLTSQVKMRLATGDAAWEKALAEEIGHAMAKRPFAYARPEYFQGNALTDDQRIVRCLAEGKIGDRGAMLFPPLGYAWRWTKDRRYLDLGMMTVAIAVISGEYQDPLYALAAVFLQQAREAGLGPADERRAWQQAIDIMKGAARPTLSNPGFEQGRTDWKAWSVKATTSSYWVPVRDKALLLDTGTKKEGRQSLHVVLTRKNPPQGFGVPLDSEWFVLDKGRGYTIEGWVRTRGEVTPGVSLRTRPLAMDVEPQSVRGVVGKPDADGWRRWRLVVEPAADCLARISLGIGRHHAKAEGEGWWDGITVKASATRAKQP